MTFESGFSSDFLPVLDYLITKADNIRKAHGGGWFPFTKDKELQNNLGLTKREAQKATRGLIGIISEVVIPFWDYRYNRSVFLPPSRKELAKEIVAQYK